MCNIEQIKISENCAHGVTCVLVWIYLCLSYGMMTTRSITLMCLTQANCVPSEQQCA